MALRFVDGFDHYNVADLPKKWSTVGAGAATATMDTGQSSGQSLKQVIAGTNVKHLIRAHPSPHASGGVGFALKVSARPPSNQAIVCSLDTTYPGSGVGLMYGANGTLSLFKMSGYYSYDPVVLVTGGVIPLDSWLSIEVKWFLDAAGYITLNVNGVQSCTITGDVRPYLGYYGYFGVAFNAVMFFALYSFWNGITLYPMNYTGSLWIDDVYTFDGATGITDFLGGPAVSTRLVGGNGATNDGIASIGDQHSCVDEQLADASDYVGMDAVDEVELYTMETLPPMTIRGAQVTVMGSKVGSSAAAVTSLIRQGGANYPHATPQGLGSETQFLSFIHEKSGLGADWTDTAFNAAQFGVKKTL